VTLLVFTIKDLFDNYSLKEFIIAATVRNEDTFRTFLDACGKLSPFFSSQLWPEGSILFTFSVLFCLVDI
jgi:hypothetical protein